MHSTDEDQQEFQEKCDLEKRLPHIRTYPIKKVIIGVT
jgi:hypothetical protein